MGNEIELLPCPFCGAEGEYDSSHYTGRGMGPEYSGHSVYCGSAQCPYFTNALDGSIFDTKEDAVEAWNTRTNAELTNRLARYEKFVRSLYRFTTKDSLYGETTKSENFEPRYANQGFIVNFRISDKETYVLATGNDALEAFEALPAQSEGGKK